MVQQMILNDMGMNLLVDAPPAKVTERKHAEEKIRDRDSGARGKVQ
jgi:hypothetical protein